jgi:chorismate mutase
MPPSLTPPSANLLRLRGEIDAIDAELHACLLRRAGLVAQIEAEKRVSAGRSAYRPVREADMMRRIVERHRGPFPLAAAEHIFREIISSFIRLQAPFTVHLSDMTPELRDLARFQFGALTPLVTHADASAALSGIEARGADLALVPLDAGPDVWWEKLGGADGLNIVARVPFLVGLTALPQAYVIARLPPEASGDDRTLYALTGAPSDTPDAMLGQLPATARPLAARVAGGRHFVLASTPGFATTEPDFPVRRVGAYAVPLSVS